MFLRPQFDESIHGFFIRVLFALGLAKQAIDLKGVISRHGVIRMVPRLTSHGAFIMDSLFVDDVYGLAIDHGKLNRIEVFCPEDLAGYIFLGDELPRFMRKDEVNKRTQLRYCPSCFSEQIREYGFSWFRLPWLSSVTCDIHNEYLSEVYQSTTKCCGSGSSILGCIRSAMSGVCVKCKNDSWSFCYKVHINSHLGSYHLL